MDDEWQNDEGNPWDDSESAAALSGDPTGNTAATQEGVEDGLSRWLFPADLPSEMQQQFWSLQQSMLGEGGEEDEDTEDGDYFGDDYFEDEEEDEEEDDDSEKPPPPPDPLRKQKDTAEETALAANLKRFFSDEPSASSVPKPSTGKSASSTASTRPSAPLTTASSSQRPTAATARPQASRGNSNSSSSSNDIDSFASGLRSFFSDTPSASASRPRQTPTSSVPSSTPPASTPTLPQEAGKKTKPLLRAPSGDDEQKRIPPLVSASDEDVSQEHFDDHEEEEEEEECNEDDGEGDDEEGDEESMLDFHARQLFRAYPTLFQAVLDRMPPESSPGNSLNSFLEHIEDSLRSDGLDGDDSEDDSEEEEEEDVGDDIHDFYNPNHFAGVQIEEDSDDDSDDDDSDDEAPHVDLLEQLMSHHHHDHDHNHNHDHDEDEDENDSDDEIGGCGDHMCPDCQQTSHAVHGKVISKEEALGDKFNKAFASTLRRPDQLPTVQSLMNAKEGPSSARQAVYWALGTILKRRGDPSGDLRRLMYRRHDSESIKALLAEGGVSLASECGKVWNGGEWAYKCSDCGLDPATAICLECFEPEKHVNHKYRLIRTGGGCCDCGDPQAWKPEGFCSRHDGASADDSKDYTHLFPAGFRERALRIFEELVCALVQSQGMPSLTKFVLRWLAAEGMTSHPLRQLLTQALLQGKALRWMLQVHPSMPASFQAAYEELYFLAIRDPRFKHAFTVELLQLYPRAASEHGERSLSQRFGVQIFTVPSLSRYIAVESGFLPQLVEIVCGHLSALTRPRFLEIDTPPLGAPAGKPHAPEQVRIRRLVPNPSRHSYFSCLYDLNYILQHAVASEAFLTTPALYDQFFHTLFSMTYLEPNIRRLHSHIPFEADTWRLVFQLFSDLDTIRYQLSFAFSNRFFGRIESPASSSSTSTASDVAQLYRADIISTDPHYSPLCSLLKEIDKAPVDRIFPLLNSVHSPLHRYFASLLSETYFRRPEWTTGSLPPSLLLKLLATPLETQRFLAQTAAGMWVRNGLSILQQADTAREFGKHPYEYLELDIFLLQFCMLQMAEQQSPDAFVSLILERFQVNPAELFLEPCALAADQRHQQRALLAAALRLLIQCLCERSRLARAEDVPGFSDVATSTNPVWKSRWVSRQRLACHIRHTMFLTAGSCPHSAFSAFLPSTTTSHPRFEDALQEIAAYQPPTETAAGRFSFRDASAQWALYEPYFLYYSDEQSQTVEQHLHEFRRAHLLSPPTAVPIRQPVSQPPVIPQFAALPKLLSNSAVLSDMLFAILQCFARGDAEVASHKLLTSCLHLFATILPHMPSERVSPFHELLAAVITDQSEKPEAADFIPLVRSVLDQIKVLSCASPNPSPISSSSSSSAAPSEASLSDDSLPTQPETTPVPRAKSRKMTIQERLMRKLRRKEQTQLSKIEAQTQSNNKGSVETTTITTTDPCCSSSSSSSSLESHEDYCALCHDTASVPDDCLCFVGTVHPTAVLEAVFGAKPGSENTFLATCGHTVHQKCFKSYFSTFVREQRMLVMRTALRPESGDFKCPVCRNVSNILVPTHPSAPNASGGVEAFMGFLSSISFSSSPSARGSTDPAVRLVLVMQLFITTLVSHERALLPSGLAISPVTLRLFRSLHDFMRLLHSQAAASAPTQKPKPRERVLGTYARLLTHVICDNLERQEPSLTAIDPPRLQQLVASQKPKPDPVLLVSFVRSLACLAADPPATLQLLAEALKEHDDIPARLAAEWTSPLYLRWLEYIPEKFQETGFLTRWQGTKCMQCHKSPPNPAICLFCGSLVCMNSQCCTVAGKGECFEHARRCSPGGGLFLSLGAAAIWAVTWRGGYWTQPVFLNKFGEDDFCLEKGFDLFLSLPRIQRLWKLLLLHGFTQEMFSLEYLPSTRH